MKKTFLFYLFFSLIFSQDEYNLSTCHTDISPDAPDFFHKYYNTPKKHFKAKISIKLGFRELYIYNTI